VCISKSDKSCIANPKSEISDWTAACWPVEGEDTPATPAGFIREAVQSEILVFGFAMQDLSDFKILDAKGFVIYVVALLQDGNASVSAFIDAFTSHITVT
jgi:hypothetical protein